MSNVNTPNTLSFNEEFNKLWNTAVSRWSSSGAEDAEKRERAQQHQLLAQMISSERFFNPQETLVQLIETIEKDKNLYLSRGTLAMETFEVVFQAAPLSARHNAWVDISQRVAQLSLDVFSRLSTKVLKDKLLNTPDTLSFNEEFNKLWNTAVYRWSSSGAQNRAKREQPEHHQLLAQMISSERFSNPQEALVRLIETIEKESRRPMRPIYPLIVAMETFEVVFQAAPLSARHSAWVDISQRVAELSPNVFERLSTKVLKDKLLAQKEVQMGLVKNDSVAKI